MAENKYRQLVSEMGGGVGWRDLRAPDMRRDATRDVEITDVQCTVIEETFHGI